MIAARFSAGNASEYGARHQAGAAGIVEIEQSADQFACRIKSGQRSVLDIQHARGRVDFQSAECEGDAGRDRVPDVGRRVERLSPVRFGQRQPARAPPVLHGGVELHVGHHRRVEVLDRLHEAGRVDLELARQAFQRRILGARDLADAVLLAEQLEHLLVEDLERRAAWLEIFGSRSAPILAADPVGGYYTLDLERLNPEQRKRIVRHLSGLRKETVDSVDRRLAEIGALVPAADVDVQYVLAE